MTRRRTWRLVRIVTLGVVLTAAVAILDRAGSLLALEQWTYDMRVRYCQRYFAKPDDGIVHVMIDDVSLEQDKIGGWPWPRSRWAALLDEAVRDGAANVAFDVIMDDPGPPDPLADGTLLPGAAADVKFVQSVRAASAAGHRVLLPVAMTFLSPNAETDDTLRRATDVLRKRLDTSTEELAAELKLDVMRVRGQYYHQALVDAMALIARDVVHEGTLTDDAAVARYLPGTVPNGVPMNTPESNAFRVALRLAHSAAKLEEVATQPGDADDRLLRGHVSTVPIDAIARAATDSGFANYLPTADGHVRVVPLLAAADGRLWPHFSLVLTAMRLGVDLTDPDQVELSAEKLILRPPGRPEIRVPVRVALAGDPPRPIGAIMDIPMRGGADFHTLYAPRSDAFVSAFELWRVSDGDRKVRDNLAKVAGIVKEEMPFIDPDDPAADDPPAVTAPDAVIAAGQRLVAAARAKPNKDPSERGQRQRGRVQRVADALQAIPLLRQYTDEDRRQLRQKLGGKTAVFGWSATSQAADHVSTSLHADCPGVAIHGTIASAIAGGELWTHLPPGYATTLTIVCGVLTTLAVTLLAPSRALIASGGLLLLVAGGASAVLFDRYNVVIGLAGPMTAVVVCWAACTLVVTLRERLDRAQVTRRFRSYVDPALVTYVLDHPESQSLAGESREMTVVFIDVEGFTALTEKMGEKSIAILRNLMDALVPIIRRHNGFVNKFLGDGVMFFYGAPRHDPDHARHAVRTVLEMQQALGKFNASQPEDVPKLGVRAGISTGTMLVGDAGSADASDYTVLGDAVNLASRLEGANKPLGTAALATARTAELCGDEFLFAPLGRLIVVGKENAVAVCEPMADLTRATDDQKACAAGLEAAWSHIDGRRVLDAVAAVDALRAAGGRTKLCELLHTLLRDLQTVSVDTSVSIRLSGK